MSPLRTLASAHTPPPRGGAGMRAAMGAGGFLIGNAAHEAGSVVHGGLGI